MVQKLKISRLQIADENGEFHDICNLCDKDIQLEFGETEFTGTLRMDLANRIRWKVWMMIEDAKAIARRILD